MKWSLLRTVAITLALYFLGVSVLFVVENFEILDKVPVSDWIKTKLNNSDWLYELHMRMIPRPLESHYVTLVSLEWPFAGGSCETRDFFAKLLPRLVEMQPAMIVSDVGFGKENCGENKKSTIDLKAAIAAALKTTPLILAEGGNTLARMPTRKAEELRGRGFEENDLLMQESIALPKSEVLQLGLIWMNSDLKKIPIRWYAREEKGPLHFEDSLPFAAAKMYRSNFPDRGARLENIEKDSYHPYLSFLSDADFSTVPAIEAICGEAHIRAHDWTSCGPDEGSPKQRKKLHGRILMLGFADDPDDLWSTPAGKLPGYALQANYLEALLDARVYKPLSLWAQVSLGFLWLCLVELPFWRHDFRTRTALIYSFFISCLVMFIVYYIALVNFGWYISLGPPSALAIVARVVYQNLERKGKHEGP